MKISRLAFICLLLILLTTASLHNVQANTLEYDFGETNILNSNGEVAFTIDVKAEIQTDQNNNWILNNSYQTVWHIAVTYLNKSLYNSTDFSVSVGNPQGTNDSRVLQEVGVGNSDAGLQYKGLLIVTFTPQFAPMIYNLNFSFSYYVVQSIWDTTPVIKGTWFQSSNSQLISINVEDTQSSEPSLSSPSPTVPEFPMMAIPLFLSILSFAIILRLRKQRIS